MGLHNKILNSEFNSIHTRNTITVQSNTRHCITNQLNSKQRLWFNKEEVQNVMGVSWKGGLSSHWKICVAQVLQMENVFSFLHWGNHKSSQNEHSNAFQMQFQLICKWTLTSLPIVFKSLLKTTFYLKPSQLSSLHNTYTNPSSDTHHL